MKAFNLWHYTNLCKPAHSFLADSLKHDSVLQRSKFLHAASGHTNHTSTKTVWLERTLTSARISTSTIMFVTPPLKADISLAIQTTLISKHRIHIRRFSHEKRNRYVDAEKENERSRERQSIVHGIQILFRLQPKERRSFLTLQRF